MIVKEGSLLDRILEVIFPSRVSCIVCDDDLFHDSVGCICDKCNQTLPKTYSHICEKCGESLDSLANFCLTCKKSIKRYFKVARAPFMYDGEIVKLIHNLKYNDCKYLGSYLSEILVEEYKKNNFDVDIVIPIPLNPKRLKERGYNQAFLLCRKFETDLKLPIDTTSLIRKVDTPTQTKLTKQERKQNLENAFQVVDKSAIKGKRILLIDDVYTTGATLEEASKTLLKAGAKEIYCLTVAHTLPPHLRDYSYDEEDEETDTKKKKNEKKRKK